jgi:hypothetical protein
MKEINVSLKIEEINLVLSSLGNLPFIQVHELIGKIQGQASAQLAPPANGESKKKQNPEPERILEPEHN